MSPSSAGAPKAVDRSNRAPSGETTTPLPVPSLSSGCHVVPGSSAIAGTVAAAQSAPVAARRPMARSPARVMLRMDNPR